jgi:hypothetical protein
MPKKVIAIFVILLISYYSFATDSYIILPAVHKTYEIKEDQIYFRAGNGGIIVKSVRGDDVSNYYSARGAEWLGNPFMREEFAGPTVFMVTILNRTNGNATFTPGLVTIKIGDEASFPVDYISLTQVFESVSAREKKVLEDSIFHSPETIKAGQVVSKFLLFPPLPEKNFEFRLEFDYLYFESKEVHAKFYFKKERIRAKN